MSWVVLAAALLSTPHPVVVYSASAKTFLGPLPYAETFLVAANLAPDVERFALAWAPRQHVRSGVCPPVLSEAIADPRYETRIAETSDDGRYLVEVTPLEYRESYRFCVYVTRTETTAEAARVAATTANVFEDVYKDLADKGCAGIERDVGRIIDDTRAQLITREGALGGDVARNQLHAFAAAFTKTVRRVSEARTQICGALRDDLGARIRAGVAVLQDVDLTAVGLTRADFSKTFGDKQDKELERSALLGVHGAHAAWRSLFVALSKVDKRGEDREVIAALEKIVEHQKQLIRARRSGAEQLAAIEQASEKTALNALTAVIESRPEKQITDKSLSRFNFTVDAGVGAFSFGSGIRGVAPVVGLNFYFLPVDTTLPLWSRHIEWYQLVSVVAGVTATRPGPKDRVRGLIADGVTPFVGVGVRQHDFFRITVGAVLAEVQSTDKFSTRVGGFVSTSVDLDIAQLVVKAVKLVSP